MNNYKAIVIGCKAKNTLSLKNFLCQYYPNISIVAEIERLESVKTIFLGQMPHIVFMDIELGNCTAFDLLEEVFPKGTVDFEIIFFTRSICIEYAIKAIDFSPAALLTYPVNTDILREGVDKAIIRIDKKVQFEKIVKSQFVDNVVDSRILISSVNHSKISVSVADILYLKADGQTTVVYLNDDTNVTAFNILGHFKKILLESHPFFLVHNSIMVNVSHIRSFRYSELEITLKNGKKLFASRRFGKAFKNYWDEFNCGRSTFPLLRHQQGVNS